MFNKFKNVFEKEKVTVQKFKPLFTTVDGVEHEGETCRWCISDRLRCEVPEYIMNFIKSDGYIKGKDGVMYILSNIISIRWILLEERILEDNFSEYKTFLATDELGSC